MEFQKIEATCPESQLLKAFWLQSIHIPWGHNAYVTICPWWGQRPTFPSNPHNVPEPGGGLPMSFQKPRETCLQVTPKWHVLAPDYTEVYLCLCCSRFFLNTKKLGSFCGLKKVIYSFKPLGGLLTNCYSISMQCFFVTQISLYGLIRPILFTGNGYSISQYLVKCTLYSKY